MSLTYVGNLTIGAAIPGASASVAAGATGINVALPDILARIAALQAFSPTPLAYPDLLALAQSTLSSIQAGITAGLPLPDISAQILAVQALVAALLATVNAVNAQLNIITDFQTLLASAGIHVYAYAGQVDAAGGEITTALASGLPSGGGGASAANGLLLMTEAFATWTAMSSVFQVTP